MMICVQEIEYSAQEAPQLVSSIRNLLLNVDLEAEVARQRAKYLCSGALCPHSYDSQDSLLGSANARRQSVCDSPIAPIVSVKSIDGWHSMHHGQARLVWLKWTG